MANRQAQSKDVVLLNGTIATNATTSAMVDRLGFDFVDIEVIMPPATATNSSAKWGALALKHSDTTAVSDAVNIAGLIGTTNATAATGTAAEFVIAANNTTTAAGTTSVGGGQITGLSADLRGRGRYLFLIAQAAASHQTAVAIAHLFKGEKMPSSAAERNAGAVAVAQ